MKEKNEELTEFLLKLDTYLSKEELTNFEEELKTFNLWLKTLTMEEQKELLPIGIREVAVIINKAKEKKLMYEEIALDNTSKKGVNEKYSQY